MLGRVRRLWRGEVPLATAFWRWAVIGGFIVNAVTSVLFLVLMVQDLPIAALAAGYLPSVPYNILVAVGVWRAADRYDGERVWAETARVLTLVGLLLLSVT